MKGSMIDFHSISTIVHNRLESLREKKGERRKVMNVKTNKKIGLILIVFLTCLLLFSGQPGAYAATTTLGGEQEGVMVRETIRIDQYQYLDYASDLEFTLWVELGLYINGWKVTISNFTSSSSTRSTDMYGISQVFVKAWGAIIPFGSNVVVDAIVWISGQNDMRMKDVNWTRTGDPEKALPDHGWAVAYPSEDPLNPGHFNHTLTIFNDDLIDSLNVTGLAFNATMDYYKNLTTIIFPSALPDFTVGPENNWSIPIPTLGSLVGGHIYFRYGLKNATGNVFFNETADHLVTPSVGGHDVAVISVDDMKSGCVPLPTVCQGMSCDVYVTVKNKGYFTETFNVTAYANSTIIGKQKTTLDPGQNTTLAFTWKTTGLAEYKNHMISATADQVSDETNLADNTLTDGTVTIVHQGDVDGNGLVDTKDIAKVAGAFGSLRVNDPKDPRYGQYWHPTACRFCPHSPNADIDGNGFIDTKDLSRTAANFGWHKS
jgi:hypothetical protein